MTDLYWPDPPDAEDLERQADTWALDGEFESGRYDNTEGEGE